MAHGLVLRMKDMLEHQKLVGSQDPLSMSKCPDANIIKAWITAVNNPKNSKLEYFDLLRRTLLYILSSKWPKSAIKGDLIYAFKYHYKMFSTITDNTTEVYNLVLRMVEDPWHNPFFWWGELFEKRLTIKDKIVQEYFASEPEEVVLARVDSFSTQKEWEAVLRISKTSFLYHSRIARSFRQSISPTGKIDSSDGASTNGHASIDWFMLALMKNNSLTIIAEEVKDLTCHEGVEIICRLWRDGTKKNLCYALIKIFILQDLVKPSKYCCTKMLFTLFCLMHKEIHSRPEDIVRSARKLLIEHAPTSAHLYLFVDVFWKQFGMRYLNLYLEFFVRALSADINHLECKKSSESYFDVTYLEAHIASMFDKLSTLFSGLYKEITRECVFSAFSLRPSKERLHVLLSLTQSLSENNKNSPVIDSSSRINFSHPLLTKSFKSISSDLITDFVSVLESVRSINFQYNVFDWQKNVTELEDYLKAYTREKNVLKEWGSDTEMASDESYRSDPEDIESVLGHPGLVKNQIQPIHSPVKRKSDSEHIRNMNLFDIGSNIVEQSIDNASKRVKIENPYLESHVQVPRNPCQSHKNLTDALENLITVTLNDGISKSEPLMYTHKRKPLNQSEEMYVRKQQQVSSTVRSPSPTIYKKTNLSHLKLPHENKSTSIQRSFEGQINSSSNYSYKIRPQTPNTLPHATPRQSVVVSSEKNISFRRVFSSQQHEVQNTYSMQSPVVKTASPQVPKAVEETYSRSIRMQRNEESTDVQGAMNLSLNNSYEKEKHVQKYHRRTSQFVSSQPPPKSSRKSHPAFLPIPDAKLESLSALTLSEAKKFVSHDRNSVIQHTMQHAKEQTSHLPSALSVPVKSSAVQEFTNDFDKEASKLSLIRITVPNKCMPRSGFPMNAKLFVPCKPGNNNVVSSYQSTMSNPSSPDDVARFPIPGVIATTSIFKPGWKVAEKRLDKPCSSTKDDHSIVSSSVKHQKIYERTSTFTSKSLGDLHCKRSTDSDIEVSSSLSVSSHQSYQEFMKAKKQQDTTNNYSRSLQNKLEFSNIQQPKPMPSNSPQHLNVSSGQQQHKPTANNGQQHKVMTSNFQTHQSQNVKYQWATTSQTNDSTKSQQLPFHLSSNSQSLATSGQPWYTRSYPKTVSSGINASFSTVNAKTIDTTADKVSTYMVNSNYPSNAQSNVPQSFLKSRLTSVHTTPSHTQVASSFQLESNFSSLAENMNKAYVSLQKQFSIGGLSEKSNNSSCILPSSAASGSSSNSSQTQLNSSFSPSLFLPRNERNVAVYQAKDAVQLSQLSNAQNTNGNLSSLSCCSPFEVNPCESCSTPSKDKRQHFPSKSEATDFASLQADQVTDDTASEFAEQYQTLESIYHSGETDPQLICRFCSFSYPATLMKIHIENSHQNELHSLKNHSALKKDTDKETSHSLTNLKSNSGSCNSQDEDQITVYSHSPSACNPILGVENSQNTEQLLSTFLDFIDNGEQSFYKPAENAENTHSLNTWNEHGNETSCNISHSESLSEMLKEVDFSRNVSPGLSAICEGDVLSYDVNGDKQRSVLTSMVEKKELEKSWINNLGLDPLSNEDDTDESGESNFKMSEFGIEEFNRVGSNNFELSQKESTSTNYANDFLVRYSFENLSGSNQVSDADKGSLNYMNQNQSEMDGITSSENSGSNFDELFNSPMYCPICKANIESGTNLQLHINECHPNLSGSKCGISIGRNKMRYGSKENCRIMEEPEGENLLRESSSSDSNNVLEQMNKDLVHPSQVFDFDSYKSDDIGRDVYKPLQKGKVKLISNSSPGISFNDTENGVNQMQARLEKAQIKNESANIKKETKGPRKPCKYCGKLLTVPYMKTHIFHRHKELLQMPENSSYDSNSNQTSLSSPTPEYHKNVRSVSALLQDNIDTSTCLSPSDALNTSTGFETLHHNKSFTSDRNGRTQYHEQNFPFQGMSDDKSKTSKYNMKFKVVEKSLSFMQAAGKEETVDLSLGKSFRYEPNITESYNCHVCLRNYPTKSYLIKHMKNLHPSEKNYEIDNSQNVKSPLSSDHMLRETVESKSNSTEIKPFLTKIPISTEDGNKYLFTNGNISGLSINQQVEESSMCQDSYPDNLNTASNSESLRPLVSEPNVTTSKNCMFKKVGLQSNPKNYLLKDEKGKKRVPKTHKCQICHKSFSYEKNLSKHVTNFHPEAILIPSGPPSEKTSLSTSDSLNQEQNINRGVQNADSFATCVSNENIPSAKSSVQKCSDIPSQNDLKTVETPKSVHSFVSTISPNHTTTSRSSRQDIAASTHFYRIENQHGFQKSKNSYEVPEISNPNLDVTFHSKPDEVCLMPDNPVLAVTEHFTQPTSKEMVNSVLRKTENIDHVNDVSSMKTKYKCAACRKTYLRFNRLKQHFEKCHPSVTLGTISELHIGNSQDVVQNACQSDNNAGVVSRRLSEQHDTSPIFTNSLTNEDLLKSPVTSEMFPINEDHNFKKCNEYTELINDLQDCSGLIDQEKLLNISENKSHLCPDEIEVKQHSLDNDNCLGNAMLSKNPLSTTLHDSYLQQVQSPNNVITLPDDHGCSYKPQESLTELLEGFERMNDPLSLKTVLNNEDHNRFEKASTSSIIKIKDEKQGGTKIDVTKSMISYKVECPICLKEFCSQSNLNQHRRDSGHSLSKADPTNAEENSSLRNNYLVNAQNKDLFSKNDVAIFSTAKEIDIKSSPVYSETSDEHSKIQKVTEEETQLPNNSQNLSLFRNFKSNTVSLVREINMEHLAEIPANMDPKSSFCTDEKRNENFVSPEFNNKLESYFTEKSCQNSLDASEPHPSIINNKGILGSLKDGHNSLEVDNPENSNQVYSFKERGGDLESESPLGVSNAVEFIGEEIVENKSEENSSSNTTNDILKLFVNGMTSSNEDTSSKNLEFDEVSMPSLTPECELQSQVTEKIKAAKAIEGPKNSENEVCTKVIASYSVDDVPTVPSPGDLDVKNLDSFFDTEAPSETNLCFSPKVSPLRESETEYLNNNLKKDQISIPHSPDVQDFSENEEYSFDSILKDFQCNDSFNEEYNSDSSDGKAEMSIVESLSPLNIHAVDCKKSENSEGAIESSASASENCLASPGAADSQSKNYSDEELPNQNCRNDVLSENMPNFHCEANPNVNSFFLMQSKKSPSLPHSIKDVVADMLSTVSEGQTVKVPSNFQNRKDGTGKNCLKNSTTPCTVKLKAVVDPPVNVGSNGSLSYLNTTNSNKFSTVPNISPVEKSQTKKLQTSKNAKNSSKRCRFCHKVFKSMGNLSLHLKSIHKVPVLKKQSAKQESKLNAENADKLLPPQLSLESSYDSDSASISTESSPGKISGQEYFESSSEDTELKEAENSNSLFQLSVADEQNLTDSSRNVNPPTGIHCHIALKLLDSKKLSEIAGKVPSHNRNSNKMLAQKLNENQDDEVSVESFRITDKECTTSNTVSISSKKDVTFQNGTLPKCIIKVCKGEQNSVTYKIDNPQNVESEVEQNTLNNRKTVTRSSEIIVLSEKLVRHSVTSYKRKRKMQCSEKSTRLKLSNVINSISKTSRVRSVPKLQKKTNENIVFLTPESQSPGVSSSLFSKTSDQNFSCMKWTYKKPEDIRQFFIDHKQPSVSLSRIMNYSPSDSSSSVDEKSSTYFHIAQNAIISKPMVVLKRLPIPSAIKTDRICLKENKLFATSQVPTVAEVNEGISKTEISTQGAKYHLANIKENCIHLSSIKRCHVLLKKLPVRNEMIV